MTVHQIACQIRSLVLCKAADNRRHGKSQAKQQQLLRKFRTFTDDEVILFWLPKCDHCGKALLQLPTVKDIAKDAVTFNDWHQLLGYAMILDDLAHQKTHLPVPTASL